MGVIIYSFDWTLHLKCHMVCLSVILLLLLCYRIACLWFWNKRFCNKTGVLFVPDPAFVNVFMYVRIWVGNGGVFKTSSCLLWMAKQVFCTTFTCFYSAFQVPWEYILDNYTISLDCDYQCGSFLALLPNPRAEYA